MSQKSIIDYWPDKIVGIKTHIVRTTHMHLAHFTKWLHWEGHYGETQQSTVATQHERVRRLKGLEKNLGLFLSILNKKSLELTALVELYQIESEIYATNLVIGSRSGIGIGLEASRLIMDFIFSKSAIQSIYMDLAESRNESRKLIESLGFQQHGYHYIVNLENYFIKILNFKITKEFWLKFVVID